MAASIDTQPITRRVQSHACNQQQQPAAAEQLIMNSDTDRDDRTPAPKRAVVAAEQQPSADFH